ncbi:hypothetical protein ACFCW6_09535 [Streptomyces sp. NPDC056333]|uniref:hypothetical protein n=1 Tax=Streptomyces sp. NPDC056333 TaxID=3345786 RepID=UPI0035DDC641
MVQMPGTVKSARALLLVVGAGNIVASLWLMTAAATLQTGAMGQLVIGLLLLAALPFGTLAAAAIVTAAKFTTGGHRVRIGAVAVGSLTVVGSPIIAGTAISAKLHNGVWGIAVAVGALVIVLSTGQDSRDWFDRPRR